MESEDTTVNKPKPNDKQPTICKEQQQKPTQKLPASGNEKKRKANQSTKVRQKNNKKKQKREEGAPKFPLTGYVRYMNKRRDELKLMFPDKTSIEVTKLIAEEWNAMGEELKKPYLQAAEADRERYNQEITVFNKNKIDKKIETQTPAISNGNGSTVAAAGGGGNGIKSNINAANNKTQTNGKENSSVYPTAKDIRRMGEHGIPIFTDEFIDHNKSVDLELRMLRKSNIDYEQQNSVLEKHIENMKFGVEKMKTENSELAEKNRLLENYLQKLKLKLVQSFSALSIPSEPNGATVENIEKYMTDLHDMATSNSHGPACLNKAKDIIRKLDLQIQL